MDTKQLDKFKKHTKKVAMVAGMNLEHAELVLSLVTDAYEKGQKDAADQIAKLARSMYKES